MVGLVGLMDKIADSGSADVGSIPTRDARKNRQSCTKIDGFFNEIHLLAHEFILPSFYILMECRKSVF